MKLTRASTYALHAVTYLAQQKQDYPIPSHVAAEARGIPERFLLKVLKPLVSVRILRAVKGPNGGYRLAKPAKDISLLEIVEAVDGPIQGQAPDINGNGKKNDKLNQQLDDICIAVAKQTRQQLQKVNVASLVGKG